jgi:8-oxo-dGTP pyrophosphatase MutT (NUDIX family)
MLRLTLIRLVPRPLHVIALRSIHAVRLRWWHLRGTRVSGCRVVVLDAEDRVLLIRHSYGAPHWMLPGGGMKRGEDPIAAALREAHEEAGVRMNNARHIGMVTSMAHGGDNEVHVIAGWTTDSARPDGREIVEAHFFALDALPSDLSAKLRPLLPDYVTTAKAARLPRD